MSAGLGQPVVIENISGASGVLGVDRAAKSAGRLYAGADQLDGGLHRALRDGERPSSRKDLALITTVVRVPEVVVVNQACL
jgi:tripartite-type tricarboxylate transporter receptor subunit TctC